MEQRFGLRHPDYSPRRLLSPLALLTVAWALAFYLFVFIVIAQGDTKAMLQLALVLVLPMFVLVPLSMIWRAWISRSASVFVLRDRLIVRGRLAPESTIPLERVLQIRLAKVAALAAVRTWPLWRVQFDVLNIYGDALVIRLATVVRQPFPFASYHTLLIDPEDLNGFVQTIRSAAPHVAIDRALLQQ